MTEGEEFSEDFLLKPREAMEMTADLVNLLLSGNGRVVDAARAMLVLDEEKGELTDSFELMTRVRAFHSLRKYVREF